MFAVSARVSGLIHMLKHISFFKNIYLLNFLSSGAQPSIFSCFSSIVEAASDLDASSPTLSHFFFCVEQ